MISSIDALITIALEERRGTWVTVEEIATKWQLDRDVIAARLPDLPGAVGIEFHPQTLVPTGAMLPLEQEDGLCV